MSEGEGCRPGNTLGRDEMGRGNKAAARIRRGFRTRTEIAGTKGLAGVQDVGHTRQIVKPGPARPAPRPCSNPGSCADRFQHFNICGTRRERETGGGYISIYKTAADLQDESLSCSRLSVGSPRASASWTVTFDPWILLWDKSRRGRSGPDWQPLRITPLSSLLTPVGTKQI